MNRIFLTVLLLSIVSFNTPCFSQIAKTPYAIKQIESSNFYDHYPDLVLAVQSFENESYFTEPTPSLLVGEWQRHFAIIDDVTYRYTAVPGQAPYPERSFINLTPQKTYFIRDSSGTTPIVVTGAKIKIQYTQPPFAGIDEICGVFNHDKSVLLCKLMDKNPYFEIFVRPGSIDSVPFK